MLSCKEISRSIASDEVAQLLWTTRLGLGLHLVRCRSCRLYAAQLGNIGAAARSHYDEADLDRLERLRNKIVDVLFDDSAPPA